MKFHFVLFSFLGVLIFSGCQQGSVKEVASGDPSSSNLVSPTPTATPTATPSPTATPVPTSSPIVFPAPVDAVVDLGVTQSASIQSSWSKGLSWIGSFLVSSAQAQTGFPAGETFPSSPFQLFDASSLIAILTAGIGKSNFDQLVSAEANYGTALKTNANLQIPNELSQTYQFKLNCAVGPTSVIISAHDLLKSPQTAVICYNGKAYVGNTNLPAVNQSDVAVPFTDLNQQSRHKITANKVIFVGGTHKTSKKSNLKVSILELDDTKGTFKFSTISGLKSMAGELRVAKVVTPSLIQLIPNLSLSQVGKAMVIANLDSSKTITGFQILEFLNPTPTDFAVTCNASIAQKFQGICPAIPDVPDVPVNNQINSSPY